MDKLQIRLGNVVVNGRNTGGVPPSMIVIGTHLMKLRIKLFHHLLMSKKFQAMLSGLG